MLKLGGKPDLPLEPFGADRLRELGVEDFDGDGTFVLDVVRQIDRGHSPPAERSVDRVAGNERFLKGFEGVAHGRRLSGGMQRVWPNGLMAARQDGKTAGRQVTPSGGGNRPCSRERGRPTRIGPTLPSCRPAVSLPPAQPFLRQWQ